MIKLLLLMTPQGLSAEQKALWVKSWGGGTECITTVELSEQLEGCCRSQFWADAEQLGKSMTKGLAYIDEDFLKA